mmetsp:Transcript_53059/g.114748  ORF Transcript_53059/g.114748 Transcript_53059/m.114748 type:complete len:263 (-) Transcript_53059:1615-2403(-)
MSLLHLVEEDNPIGSTPHRLRQLSTLLVSHVAWRCTSESGHRELLHVLAHVNANHGLLAVKEPHGQGLRQLRLSNACRPEEKQRSNGTVGVAESIAGSLHSLCHSSYSIILPNDPLVKLIGQVHETLPISHRHALQRDARLHGNHLLNISLRDCVGSLCSVWRRTLHLRKLLHECGELAVLDLPSTVEVVSPLRLRELQLEILNLLLHDLQRIDLLALLVPLRLGLSLLCLQLVKLHVDAAQTLHRLRIAIVRHAQTLHLQL